MTELYFMRHGQRIDHALELDANAKPMFEDYKPYDPSLAISAQDQIEECCDDIVESTKAFKPKTSETLKKNIFIHFSPYLRCCQTADLLITYLKPKFEAKYPNYKIRFQLLGDFALSEWIHDKMKNKPPFIDSNDAYQMYTPNIKLLKNRSACSNFRPCVTLGHYNGFDLSYKDYQDNCKEYFKRLLATYDKPTHIKNQDIVIIVSHGYFINNILSYFVNHPIFDEIPEAKINFARKIRVDDDGNEVDLEGDEDEDPHYNWSLMKDSLGLFGFNAIDTSLNLETDIVYYKTNFIKRDELNPKKANETKKEDKPRPSFKIPHTSQSYQMANCESLHLDLDSKAPQISSTKDNHKNPHIIDNPICPAAKDWSPQKLKTFAIKSEFKLKMMGTGIFKNEYDITKPPIRPVTPEVSPCSEPTRNNSVIDLSKLSHNKDHRPLNLKYSTTAEIPLHQLNQKVNSQVNLAQFQRSNPSSNNSSLTDFPKFFTHTNKRAISNPIVVTGQNQGQSMKESYFPTNLTTSPKVLTSTLSNDSLYEDIDISNLDTNDLAIIEELNTKKSPHKNVPPTSLLSRSKSAKYKQELAMNSGKNLLAMYQKQQSINSSSDNEEEKYSLSFGNNRTERKQPSPTVHRTRSRKNSIKFYPSVMNVDQPINREGNSTPVGFYASKKQESSSPLQASPINNDNEKPEKPTFQRPPLVPTKSKSMFYNLDSESDSNESISSDDESPPDYKNEGNKYTWFGQNRD
ncbi:hypothetical protein CLIB1444_01S20428 [[Candida] jaroonii]|uniref:Uncharacterized protein n=1 Tax=[Candida] jaroonii TaxID=467808 RepID=A0ACA9Y2A1_9ASCO|nr:hypothetical protein CLIB1444_01S20428 [[Candida] jaroonii]